MVTRLYVEKKAPLAGEARALLSDLRTLLGIESLEGLRLLNRYDVEGLDETLFEACRTTIFSEPQLDLTYDELPKADAAFAIEPDAPAQDALGEALLALKSLGYTPQEAAAALKGVKGQAETPDELIKLALRHMAQNM